MNRNVDIILDSPDVYLTDEEWVNFNNLLEKNGLTTYVDLHKNHVMRNACFDNFLTLMPSATDILLNALIYPVAFEAIKYTIVSMAHYIGARYGWHKTSDRMPHITFETEIGRIHAPIPQEISKDNFSEYMHFLEQALKTICPQHEIKQEELIFDIDEGISFGTIRTFEEYGNKHR